MLWEELLPVLVFVLPEKTQIAWEAPVFAVFFEGGATICQIKSVFILTEDALLL